MTWDPYKDELMLREVLLLEPYKFKVRTKLRGAAWSKIAENLNKLDPQKFKVDQRSVRERFDVLKSQCTSELRKQETESGGNPEESEVMNAMESILENMKEAERIQNEKVSSKAENDEKEKAAAADMREKAMETFAESKKRKDLSSTEKETKAKKSRSSGSDTINYLREKAENEQDLRKEELELKKRKYDLLDAQQKASENQQQDLLRTMQQQMQQNQQMLLMMSNIIQKKL